MKVSTLSLNQFTVLCAFCFVSQDQIVVPIALATGTKSVGQNVLCNDGSIVVDSHAEVIARRALQKYFLELVLNCLKNPTLLDSPECFIEVYDTGKKFKKFKLKDNIRLYMYTSDSPCGDCSIYEKVNNEKMFTGAKTLLSTNCVRHREISQTIGILRVLILKDEI